MPLDNAERLYLERQIVLARAILVALALVALIEVPGAVNQHASLWFLDLYFVLALAKVFYERVFDGAHFRVPLSIDIAALAFLLILTPSVLACWFLFLFVVFSIAMRGNDRAMFVLVAIGTVAIILRVAASRTVSLQNSWHWLSIGVGALVSGLAIGFLGAREREHAERRQFLEKITQSLQFERGLTESIRQALGQLIFEFACEQACLAIRDEELERIFVWKVHTPERDSEGPETLPLSRSDTFLTDSFEVSLCWQYKDVVNTGFGWDRRTGKKVRSLLAPPESTRQEFGARSLLAVTIDSEGRPAGRILLFNSRKHFTQSDLLWLEQIVRQIGPQLENIFLLRHLRARAVESERSRISRDLHDGILQTLLSLNIQLDVLRHKFPWTPQQAGKELETLQTTVKQESEELRRMVTDLRPLRVESADMRELMLGFAERFRNESGLAVDLFIEDRDLRMPDRICRDMFQIYREALHNVKKHATASHVVVKLGQDEAKVSLVIDDNGRGFSFSGRFASEELDRLRLGPISIKERTRSVGGTLTVESNPGHGARLTVEIPLN